MDKSRGRFRGLRFEITPLASAVAIELEEITKAFGDEIVFSHFTRSLCKGDRIVLTGPNGAGKTTLLKCILGEIPVDHGRIWVAPTAKIAYLDQDVKKIPLTQTPMEYFEHRFQLSEESLRSQLHQAALGGGELIHTSFASFKCRAEKKTDASLYCFR